MKLLLGLVGVMMLSACVPFWQTRTAATPEQLWEQHQSQQASIESWAFKGRTAIIQGREGWNAGIQWQEQGQQFHIKLSGPFSQGGLELDGDAETVRLTLDDGETMEASTPEQLLAEAVGWLLPVSALRDWVRGLPYAKLPIDSKTLDEQGRLTRLEQDGWQIEFIRYMPFQGTSMPAKVFMKHPEMSIRLVVSGWSQPK